MSVWAVVCVAGAIIVAAGSASPWLGVRVAPSLWLQATGVLGMGVAGASVLFDGQPIGCGFTSSISPAVGIDRLSGALLATLALVAAPAAVFAGAVLADDVRGRALAMLTGLFPLVLAGFIVARDPSLFLGAWELMTLVPAAAILVGANDAGSRRTAFQYLAMTHVGGVGVWVAILVLANHNALGGAGPLDPATGAGTLVAVAAIVGFGTKAGVVPFHGWLPRAHPEAPSHISAVMSGVMVMFAVYGLIRTLFEWLATPTSWIGFTLLALGAMSALTGAVAAVLQRDLKRVLAYSSIDNIGIVLLALGAAALLIRHDAPDLAGVALAAGLLHIINHAAFKGLLFLGAGALQSRTGGLDLDAMGGLLRRMPMTGAAIGIGIAAISGIPPLNGFASEWLSLQALLSLHRTGSAAVTIAGVVAIAALAAAAGLAMLCFVRVGGLAMLGGPRTQRAADAREVVAPMHVPMLALASACVLLGLAPGLLIPPLAASAPWSPSTPPTHAGLEVPGSSIGTIAVAVGLALIVALLVSLRRPVSTPAPVWACGQRLERSLAWTSFGFTKTFMLSIEPVARPERTLDVERVGGIVQSVSHDSRVTRRFDAVFGTVARASLAAARHARRLQSGDLRLYVGYLVGTLVILLALVTTGALG